MRSRLACLRNRNMGRPPVLVLACFGDSQSEYYYVSNDAAHQPKAFGLIVRVNVRYRCAWVREDQQIPPLWSQFRTLVQQRRQWPDVLIMYYRAERRKQPRL